MKVDGANAPLLAPGAGAGSRSAGHAARATGWGSSSASVPAEHHTRREKHHPRGLVGRNLGALALPRSRSDRSHGRGVAAVWRESMS